MHDPQSELDFAADRHYPFIAGDQGGDTDSKAAAQIEACGRADTLRHKVKALVRAKGTLTPDETAELLQEDVLSIRPRFTELKQQGVLADTGLRRPSRMGKSQRVYRIA